MTNPPSVSTIADCPEPTANSVPDAHAPPSCMPIAKIVAPTSSASPSRLAVAFGTLPNRPVPVPASSAITVAAVPSRSVCARRPCPLPTAMSWRHAEVKPNREWNSARPNKSPSASSTPNLAP